jgi:hypothetical protein
VELDETFGEDLARFAAMRENAVRDEGIEVADEPSRQPRQKRENLGEDNKDARLNMRRANRKNRKRMQNLMRMEKATQERRAI